MKTARIGTGSYLPKTILTNPDLYENPEIKKNFDIKKAKESLLKNLSEEEIDKLTDSEIFHNWVMQVAGINQRYLYPKNLREPWFNPLPDFTGPVFDFIGPVENMGAEAAKKALQASGIKPKDLDFITAITFTNEQSTPDPSCSIGHLIGADGVPGTHTNNACAGFVYGIIDAYEKIRAGTCKNVLVVASERLSKVTNYKDPKTASLFGDGAGAVVLTAGETGILGFSRGTRYEDKHISLENKNELDYKNLVEIVGEKNIIERIEEENVTIVKIADRSKVNVVKMGGGPKVLANAVKAMITQTKKALENANLTLKDIEYIIPHQGNGRMIIDYADRLNFPLERVCNIIKDIGNTSSSSIPITLDRLVRGEIKGCNLKQGDKILLTAVGVGYTMGAVVLEY